MPLLLAGVAVLRMISFAIVIAVLLLGFVLGFFVFWRLW